VSIGPSGGVSTGSQIGDVPGPRPAASTFTDAPAAKAALEKDFGVKVKDGTKAWTQEEMSRVHESFSKMSAADREKLKGVDLVRDSVGPAKAQAELKSGTLAGLYSPNVDTKDGARVKAPSISLFDAAFPAGGSADEQRRVSMHVITHEAGHAVEGQKANDAVAKMNGKADLTQSTKTALDTTLAADEVNRDAANTTSQAGPQSGASNDFYRVQNAQANMNKALSDMANADTPAKLTAAEGRMKTAEAARDAALKKLPASDPHASEARAMATAGDAWKTTAKPNGEARIANKTAMNEYEAAKTAATAVSSGEPKYNSKEIKSFEAFRAKSKEAPISDYGATAPAEDFAESYALYRRDPKTMEKQFPETYKWMKANHP